MRETSSMQVLGGILFPCGLGSLLFWGQPESYGGAEPAPEQARLLVSVLAILLGGVLLFPRKAIPPPGKMVAVLAIMPLVVLFAYHRSMVRPDDDLIFPALVVFAILLVGGLHKWLHRP